MAPAVAAPDAPAQPPAGAPEAYADFTPPEGAPEGFKYDPELLSTVTPVFKELGLNQDQAQKLMTLAAQRDMAAANAGLEAVTRMRHEWVSQVKADPEIGGSKLEGVKVEIGRALSHLDPAVVQQFKSAMDLTGAGDHPAFVKAFYNLAKMVNEGQHVTGGNPSPQGQGKPASKPSAAQAMYPNLPS